MFDIREEAIRRPPGGRRLTRSRPTFGVQMIPQSSSRHQLWRLSAAKIAGFGDLFQALGSQVEMLETPGGRLGGEFRVCRRLPTRCACLTVSLARDVMPGTRCRQLGYLGGLAGWLAD